MSTHVLLNLLNALEKRDKMQGLSSILSLFLQRENFRKFKVANKYLFVSTDDSHSDYSADPSVVQYVFNNWCQICV